jgi:uncharacterized protein (TIGR01777 family)
LRVTLTGATGLIGQRLTRALRDRGDEITVLSRSGRPGTVPWDPVAGPAPADALEGRDAVVHLAGEPVAQRWSAASKERIERSREIGTRNLVAALGDEVALVSSSAVGYYGPHGDEPLDESAPPGDDFLARVCVKWEAEALKHTGRVVVVRTGVVLDQQGGALAKMLPFFKAGIGGPVAGGKQYMPWIHVDDVIGIYLRAVSDPSWSGPVNATAPEPVTNKDFSRALGRVLRRPAFAPVPAFAIKTLYGEMADIVTTGQRALPRRAQELGYTFQQTALEPALRSALDRSQGSVESQRS